MSAMSLHTFLILLGGSLVNIMSTVYSHFEIRVTNREPLQESLCISVTASQFLKGAQIYPKPKIL